MLRKYFLRKNEGKRDRPNGGVIVLPLLSLLDFKWSLFFIGFQPIKKHPVRYAVHPYGVTF